MKNFLSHLFFLATFIHYSSAQVVVEWDKTFGGIDGDYATSILPDGNGGFLLAGTSLSYRTGNKTVNSFGSSDYWIVKLDSMSNVIWQKSYGGTDREDLSCFIKTSDGRYLMGGISHSLANGNRTESNIGSHDYWIVKIDTSGDILWQNNIGGDKNDVLQCVIQSTDGGYLLAGRSNSNISGDKTIGSIAGSDDQWVIKVDSIGNIQWQKSYGWTTDEEVISVTQTPDGGYILGETFNDYLIRKIDSVGNSLWTKTYGGSSIDWLYSVANTFDGGIILAGYSESDSSGDKTENNIGFGDYWIVKTDSIGNILWENTIGGSNSDVATFISQTASGEYIVGGYSKSGISGDKTESTNGIEDYWLIKLDLSGNIIWQKDIGGNSSDGLCYTNLASKAFNPITEIASGQYLLAISSLSNISGDKSENRFGGSDCWVLKLTERYNSVKGRLYIDSNSNSALDSGEYAVVGQMITETSTGRFSFSQNSGIYYLNLLDSGSYSVHPPSINYYSPQPTVHNVQFTGILQTDSLRDFAFQPNGIFDDLCISMSPIGNFRAGMYGFYSLDYYNAGTTTIAPKVVFYPDPNISFISSTPVASSISIDSIDWMLPAIAPYQSGHIIVKVFLSTGLPINTLINSFVRIDPVAGDANPSCHYASWEVFVTGSFDPNDIRVNRDTVLTDELINPPFLDYIINFQNIGNDTAFNVHIFNQDPFNLDFSTFEFITASHPVNINYVNPTRQLEFHFNNILLPDHIVNLQGSHGFVRYRIKPAAGLSAGDSITNSADICFDFNPPVFTGLATTHIVLSVGISESGIKDNEMTIFPNPTRGKIRIGSPFGIQRIDIYNLIGENVMSIKGSGITTLDCSSLPSGIYFVEAMNDTKVWRRKMVKE